jgi:hypothetical protein
MNKELYGFEINNLQIIWIYQFKTLSPENECITLDIDPIVMFVGIINMKNISILENLNIFLDKHCGDAVEKFYYLEDII